MPIICLCPKSMEETKAVSEEEKESSGVSFLFPELTVAFFYVLMTPTLRWSRRSGIMKDVVLEHRALILRDRTPPYGTIIPKYLPNFITIVKNNKRSSHI